MLSDGYNCISTIHLLQSDNTVNHNQHHPNYFITIKSPKYFKIKTFKNPHILGQIPKNGKPVFRCDNNIFDDLLFRKY